MAEGGQKLSAQSQTPIATTAGTIVKPLPPHAFVDFRTARPTDDLVHGPGFNAEMRWEVMADRGYLTPNSEFFVRNHAPTPRIDPATWTLQVEGPGVSRDLTVGYEDLLRLPSVSVVRALECAGNGRIFFKEQQGRQAPGTPWRLGAIGVAEWTGVPLREVLERAGLKATAREVMPESLDAARMRRPLPVWKALEEDTLLAFGMNGKELPPDHGFPVRVLVPRWAAVASVKWVGRIHVSEVPLFSPWNTEKYVLSDHGTRPRPVTTQVIKSALELPWPANLLRGRHDVAGRSWSACGAISRVDYSLDGGASWHPARLEGPNIPGAWARWRFAWDAKPGNHEVRARATDESGVVQPHETPWNRLGYLFDGIVGHPVRVH